MPNHTIAENLARLQSARSDISDAITAKGGTVTAGDGFEDFADDIATIPSGSSTEITGTISGYYIGSGSIAKRFGDIVIIYIYYTQSEAVYSNVAIGTVAGLVTTDEFNNKTDILAVAGIDGAKGTQSSSHRVISSVTTSCSNNVISIKYYARPITGDTATTGVTGIRCVVVFKV